MATTTATTTATTKMTARQRRRQKNNKKGTKTIQNGPKTIRRRFKKDSKTTHKVQANPVMQVRKPWRATVRQFHNGCFNLNPTSCMGMLHADFSRLGRQACCNLLDSASWAVIFAPNHTGARSAPPITRT